MTCGIYKITNLVNGKFYIGLSSNIEARWEDHKKKKNCFNQYSKPLYRAFRKYGVNNFYFEVIEECAKHELGDREKHWIGTLKSSYSSIGYNLSDGGTCGGGFNKLSKSQVDEVIYLLKTSTLSNIEIGKLFNVSDQTISDINRGKTRLVYRGAYPIRSTSPEISLCVDCGVEIGHGSNRCVSCKNITQRKVERPTADVLLNDVLTYSICRVGKKYGVSDTTIRKWLTIHNLPCSAKEIRIYKSNQ